ncbi:MAG: PLP-dependent transferase [Alphaproteobacteria bacterium]
MRPATPRRSIWNRRGRGPRGAGRPCPPPGAAKARGIAADGQYLGDAAFCKRWRWAPTSSITAATKYFVGHADALIGTVAANEAYAKRVLASWRDGSQRLGDDAYSTQRGMRTMIVRLARHQATALTLARWLAARPEVERVLYPAPESDPGHARCGSATSQASGLFGVELEARRQNRRGGDARRLRAVRSTWGGRRALRAHQDRAHGRRLSSRRALLRYHAGLEDADDLIADLAAGFERFNANL